eukprot:gb/GEZJ01002624.1/.p1 GENE.gb/GEZJ01002624.1/~~gb/GEZJ01002624.1/.p1  ORF type:complete len:797 (-),score=147.63 gb/GEZJ01002624.1/:1164-3554(-)
MHSPLRIAARAEPRTAAPRLAEALVVALDTQAASSRVFKQLKEAAARLARTRVVYRVSNDDLIAVLRSGSLVTKNALNDQQTAGYRGIHVVLPPVTASLCAVDALFRSVRGALSSNLLNILDVAGYLLTLTAAKRARNNRIILFTAGDCVYRQLHSDDIQDFHHLCTLFRDECIKVDIIYHCSQQIAQHISDLEHAFPDVTNHSVQELIDFCHSNELAFLYMITNITNGQLLSYHEAAPLVDKPTPKPKKAVAKFRGVLNIAHTLNIPVKRFTHIYPAKFPPATKLSWKASKANNKPVPVLRETQRVASAKDDTPLQSEQIITAYPYGPDLVPQSNHVDECAWHMQLEKGLHVIGFVPQSSVPQSLFLSQVDVVLPMSSCQPAVRLMRTLVLALTAENMGILARSVVTERGAPMLSYLWPNVEVDIETGLLQRCFLFIVNLPMKDDVRHFPFASLHDVYKHIPDDAVRTMDSFISSALLDTDEHAMHDSDDEQDRIWPPELCNPNLDWFHTCVIHRALAGPDGTDFPPLAQWHEQMMDPTHFLKKANIEHFEKSLDDLQKVLPLTPAPPKKNKFKPAHQAVAGDDVTLQEYLPRDETEPQDKADKGNEENDNERDHEQIIYNHESFRDMDEIASLITDQGIEDVGEEHPESDFDVLVKKGHFRFASISLIVVIQRLVRDENGIDKAIRCIKILKKAGVSNKEPQVFNNFISSLVNRSSQDNSVGRKTKAFFREIGTLGEAQSVDVIPFMEDPNKNSSVSSHSGLRKHLDRLSSKVKELTSQETKEPMLSAVRGTEE